MDEPTTDRGGASTRRLPSRWSSLPDLASLELFATVVELGSFNRAASAHGLSQPSVSERIRNLERQLGLHLLDRSPAGSVPTPAGVLVAEWVTGVLASLDELAVGAAALRQSAPSHVTIAASYTIAEHLLPAWLGTERVELEVVNSAEVLERVRAGKAEIGFVESPGPIAGLASTAIGTDELVVVVWPGHPWAAGGRTVAATELAATSLVVRETGSGTRDVLDAAVAAAGIGPVVPVAELGSNAAVRAAVHARVAPAVLSRLTVDSDIVAGRLVPVTVHDVALDRVLRAVWRRERPLGAVAASLVARATRYRRASMRNVEGGTPKARRNAVENENGLA